MRIVFLDKKLEKIYYEGDFEKKYSSDIIAKFIKTVERIEFAPDIRTIRKIRALRLHKLKGKKKELTSISLNKSWRLEIKIDKDEEGNLIIIVKLSNHYE